LPLTRLIQPSKMLFSFVVFFFVTLISKINSDEIENELYLILLNGTSSNCEINEQKEMGLCLDNAHAYDCYKYNNSVDYINVALDCDVVNNSINCYDMYLSGMADNNTTTLYCMLQYLNMTWDNMENQCIYSIYEDDCIESEYSTLICYAVSPAEVSSTSVSSTSIGSTSIVSTSISSTTVVSCDETNKIRVFGMKITKYKAKIACIVLLVLLILFCCFIGWCLVSCCSNLCKSNTNYNNQRMPQSTICNV